MVFRHPHLSLVAFPFAVVIALIREPNPQSTVLHAEIQMEILPASFDSHPPVVVRHLLKMNQSATGHNFIKSGSTLWQLALSSNFE